MSHCSICDAAVLDGRCAAGHPNERSAPEAVLEPLFEVPDLAPEAPAPPPSVQAAGPLFDAAPPEASAPARTEQAAARSRELVFAAPVPQGRRLLAGALAAVLAVAGGLGYLVFGPGGESAQAALYRRVFVPDDTHRYVASFTIDGAAESMGMRQELSGTIDMAMTERTLSVAPDGVATIRFTLDRIDAAMNGASVSPPFEDGLALTVRMAPDGEVLGVEGEEALALGGLGPVEELLGPESMGPLLPDGKVAPGDTWTERPTLHVPYLDEKLRPVVLNKLLRLRTVGGEQAAVIRSELEMPIDFRLGIPEIARFSEQVFGEEIPAGEISAIPGGVLLVMRGNVHMTSLQTIVAETSRPVLVTLDGVLDMHIAAEGMPGGEPLDLRLSISGTMSELGVDL